jgi:putative ATPase
MKELGYGRGYRYAHNFRDAFVPQDYLPDELKGRVFYHPSDRGYEKAVSERLERWRQLRRKATGEDPPPVKDP